MNCPKKGDIVYAEILAFSNAARRHVQKDCPESYIRAAEVTAVGTKYIHVHWQIGGGTDKFERETMRHVDECGSEYILHISKSAAIEAIKRKLLFAAFRKAFDYGNAAQSAYVNTPYENIEKAARLLGIFPAWEEPVSKSPDFTVGENVFFIYKSTDFNLHVGPGQIYRVVDNKVLEVAHLPLKPNGFANHVVAFLDADKWTDYVFRTEEDALRGISRLLAAQKEE